MRKTKTRHNQRLDTTCYSTQYGEETTCKLAVGTKGLQKDDFANVYRSSVHKLTNPVPYEAWRKKKTKDRWGAGGKEEEGEGGGPFRRPPFYGWASAALAWTHRSGRRNRCRQQLSWAYIQEGVGVWSLPRRPPSLPREGGRGDFDYK